MSSQIDAGAVWDAPPENPADTAARIFNVVIAYDDITAGQRGMEAFVRLQQDVEGTWDFHCDLWRFDLLHLPGVSDAATLAGLHAQMIIVSARADLDLTPPVKDWLNRSLTGKPPGSAVVVALLWSMRGIRGVSPVRVTLENAAQRRGLRFFAQELPAVGKDAPSSVEQTHAGLVPASILPGDIFHQPPRPARWGINE